MIAALRLHVERAIQGLDPQRYRQEANYTAALAGRLEGIAYRGEHGFVRIRATVYDDRGRNSTEHQYGADFAITATISDNNNTISKAILIQSKLGAIESLSGRERTFLDDQIRKMRQLVRAPKVMQVLESKGTRFPQIISGNQILEGLPYTAVALPEYFTSRVTTTLDGSTDTNTIARVSRSTISRINLVVGPGDLAELPFKPPLKKQRVYA
jgi:hypothetical protein